MKYKIIDNFLEKEEFIKIKNLMLDSNFPWYFCNSVSYKNKNDNFYFTHTFYNDHNSQSEKTFLLNFLLSKIKPKSIIRIKGNFYPQTHKII